MRPNPTHPSARFLDFQACHDRHGVIVSVDREIFSFSGAETGLLLDLQGQMFQIHSEMGVPFQAATFLV